MKLLISLSIIVMLLFGPVLNTVQGVTYVQTLPPNTILFDDFNGTLDYCSSQTGAPNLIQSGVCNYFTQDNCGNWGGTCEVIQNTSIGWGGSKSIEIRDNGGGSFGIEDFRRTFAYDHTHTLAATFTFAFSCNMQTITGLQDVGMSLEYPDNANPAQHQEFRVRFQPNQKQWQYKHGSGTWSNIVFPAGLRAFYPGVGCAQANAPHYNYLWLSVTIVGTPSTGTYSSIQTPEGSWGCTGNTGLTAGCVPNNDEGQDSSCGNGNTNSCMAVEMQVDTGGTPTSPGYWSGYLGKIIVQDVTPGNPSIIAFAINNANYLLLSFFGLIAIFAYLFPTLNKMTGHKGRFGPRGYEEQKQYYTEEQYKKDIKQRTKIVIIFLVIGAIVAGFAAYFLAIGA